MKENCFKLYFEIRDMGVDDDGNNCPAYASLGPMGFKDGVTYKQVMEELKQENFPKMLGLDGIITAERIRMITPEEYKENMEDEEDGEEEAVVERMERGRLIDADKLYDIVENRYKISSGIEHRCERDLLDLITTMEDVNAAPVVHGKWLPNQEDVYWGNHLKRMFCSVCERKAIFDSKEYAFVLTKYCPNCGALMDGKA